MFKRKPAMSPDVEEPRKLTPTQVKRARELCKKKEGDKCALCERPGKSYRSEMHRDFDLDHKDGDPHNNPENGSNWQLLCHSCNCKKNPRGKRAQPYFNGVNRLKESLKRKKEKERNRQWEIENDRLIPPTLRANLEREPVFRSTAAMLMTKHQRMKRKDLLDACCEASGASQQAGSNYLDKLCSVLGPFSYEDSSESGKRYVIWRRGSNGNEDVQTDM